MHKVTVGRIGRKNGAGGKFGPIGRPQAGAAGAGEWREGPGKLSTPVDTSLSYPAFSRWHRPHVGAGRRGNVPARQVVLALRRLARPACLSGRHIGRDRRGKWVGHRPGFRPPVAPLLVAPLLVAPLRVAIHNCRGGTARQCPCQTIGLSSAPSRPQIGLYANPWGRFRIDSALIVLCHN